MTKHMSEPMPFAENYITKSWDPLTTRFSLRCPELPKVIN
jgi:hypothetical protein